MANFGKACKKVAKTILFTLLGNIAWHFLFLYMLIVCVPLSVYRFLITKIVAPCVIRFQDEGQGVAKAVTVRGCGLGVEFSGNFRSKPTRCAMVPTFIFEGTISTAEFTTALQERWIDAVDSSGNLKYPELKQYIKSWMGFLFWHHCNKFQLTDHVKTHVIPDEFDDEQTDKFLNDLVEQFSNKPFPPGKSPWEAHLIQNYRNTCVSGQDGKKMSAFVMRFHHGMADGYAVMYAIAEDLLEKYEKVKVKSPEPAPPVSRPPRDSLIRRIVSLVIMPLRLCYDLGYMMSLNFRNGTAWKIPDSKKSYHQFYDRSKRIPISHVKEIKDKLAVSFNSVIFSGVSGGFAKQLHNLSNSGITKNLAVATFLPLPDHPKKLRNHFTGTGMDLPVKPEQSPISRLIQCEERLQMAKGSVMPLVLGKIVMPTFLSQVAPLIRLSTRNFFVSAGLTCFRASHLGEFHFNGRRGISCEVTVGCSLGDCGITFAAMSFAGYVRITVTAESAVVSREELRKLICWIEEEIEALGKIPQNNNIV